MFNNQRVDSLDYLRGAMALAVLVYHFFMWEDIQLIYPFDETVSRLGIYAVATFYVLSGASLALVNMKRGVNKDFVKTFTTKRILRIAPLFLIATTCTVLLDVALGFKNNDFSVLPSVSEFLLNYSMLFGWLSPDSYIATGAWSIGNELVFYSFFPFILLFLKKSLKTYAGFFLLTLLSTAVFSFFLLTAQQGLGEQWGLYINPLNQLYLFAGGAFLGAIFKTKKIEIAQKFLWSIFVASIGVFVFFPVAGEDQIYYVTGYGKVVLSITVFALCFSIMYLKFPEKNKTTKAFKYFGDISYSIYLLHPIAFTVCSVALGLVGVESSLLVILTSLVAAFILASISYYLIEKPIVLWGKEPKYKKSEQIEKSAS